LAIAAAARANRDYSQLVAALEMLAKAEPAGIEAGGWLREKARVEENDLGDLHRAYETWKAIATTSPEDVEARDAVARISAMLG